MSTRSRRSASGDKRGVSSSTSSSATSASRKADARPNKRGRSAASTSSSGTSTSSSRGSRSRGDKSKPPSKRSNARSRKRDTADDEDDEDEMPEYPSRVTRAGLVPDDIEDDIGRLRSLAVNVAHGDAAAVQRVFGKSKFKFVAQAASTAASEFERRVDSFLVSSETKLDLLSPGGSTVVNPKNQENRNRRAALAKLVSDYEQEVEQWEAARRSLTGKAAERATAAAATLDDGAADTATEQELAAVSTAPAEIAEMAAAASIAAGALGAAAKAAAATADDAKALVSTAGASVHSAAFKGVGRGAPQSAAALVRGIGAGKR